MTYSFPLRLVALEFSAGGAYSLGVDKQGSLATFGRVDKDIALIGGGGLRLNAFEKFQPLMEYQIEGDQFLSHKIILGVELRQFDSAMKKTVSFFNSVRANNLRLPRQKIYFRVAIRLLNTQLYRHPYCNNLQNVLQQNKQLQ